MISRSTVRDAFGVSLLWRGEGGFGANCMLGRLAVKSKPSNGHPVGRIEGKKVQSLRVIRTHSLVQVANRFVIWLGSPTRCLPMTDRLLIN